MAQHFQILTVTQINFEIWQFWMDMWDVGQGGHDRVRTLHRETNPVQRKVLRLNNDQKHMQCDDSTVLMLRSGG